MSLSPEELEQIKAHRESILKMSPARAVHEIPALVENLRRMIDEYESLWEHFKERGQLLIGAKR